MPAEIQNITLFAVGVNNNAPNKEVAIALADFIAAPSAESAFKKFGFEKP